VLLGRLEDQSHGAVEATPVGQGRGGPQEHRHVPVVPAGVHPPVVGARICQFRPLGDRQGVDVRSQCDAGPARIPNPRNRRRRRRLRADDVFDPQPIQFLPDRSGGFEFLVTEFGDLVQTMPLGGDCREVTFDCRIGGTHRVGG